MGARILVVEDNPTNLYLMVYLLRHFGYDVLTAEDGEAALRLADQERPDLIVCDIHLPELDGCEVARRLEADPVLARTPLVAVTALAMVGDRDKVLAAGFDGYIAKPINPATFVPQIEAFLRFDQRSTPQDAQATEAGQPKATVAYCGTIVVVDDSATNRKFLCSLLQPLGFKVHEAADAEEGLALACRHRPDLIITDLDMPGCSGIEVAQAAQAHPRLLGVPVIILSSSSPMLPSYRTIPAGAKFISRPISVEKLVAEVEDSLRSSSKAPASA